VFVLDGSERRQKNFRGGYLLLSGSIIVALYPHDRLVGAKVDTGGAAFAPAMIQEAQAAFGPHSLGDGARPALRPSEESHDMPIGSLSAVAAPGHRADR
jgi:hypothetical protein